MSRTARRWIAVLGLAGLSVGSVLAQPPAAPSPVYPNLLIEVGADFLKSAAARTETQSSPISTNKDGVQTRGIQTTTAHVSVETVPAATYGQLNLLVNGGTDACTDSRRKRITLGNAVHVDFCARLTIIVDEHGVRELPAASGARLARNDLRYLNADIPFPIRPLVKRIAYRAYNKQKPKLEAEIERQAKQQVDEKFREEAAKQIQRLNERYVKDFKEPMTERGVFPQRLRFMTSEHQLGVRALLNDPTGKAAAFQPVPDVHGWPDVAVRIEESILNNFTHAMFAGKTFTGEELDDEFNRLIGPLIGDVKTGEAGDKPFTITFPKEKPFEFRFFEQKFKITIRGEEYTSGGRDFDAMDTTAIYKLRKTDVGLIAERVGDLIIYPPGFKTGTDRLGAREKFIQQVLDRKFSKVLKPVFEMKELKLPEALQSKDVLVTTQVTSDKGWLTLGWRRK